MAAIAIDTNRLLRALKATGQNEDSSAEDLVRALDASQGDGDRVTRAYFHARLAVFDAKLDAMRTEIRLEVKSAPLQNLDWLAGIILVSNGVLVALTGRVAHLY